MAVVTDSLSFIYYSRTDTACQPSQFISQHLSLSSLLQFQVCLHADISGSHSSHNAPPLWPRHVMSRTSRGTDYNKPFTGFLVLRHVTAIRKVAYQSQGLSYLPCCTLDFNIALFKKSNNIRIPWREKMEIY